MKKPITSKTLRAAKDAGLLTGSSARECARQSQGRLADEEVEA